MNLDTNNSVFQSMIPYCIGQIADSMQSALSSVLFWYKQHFQGIEEFLLFDRDLVSDKMHNRILSEVLGSSTISLPYYELLLCSPTATTAMVNNTSWTVTGARAVFLQNGPTSSFRAYADAVLSKKDQCLALRKSIRKNKKKLSKQPSDKRTASTITKLEKSLNLCTQELEALYPPGFPIDTSILRSLIVPIQYQSLTQATIDKIVNTRVYLPARSLAGVQHIWDSKFDRAGMHFDSRIEEAVEDGLLLDYDCGDGLFSAGLNCRVVQYASSDHRLDRSRAFFSDRTRHSHTNTRVVALYTA